MVIVMVRLNNKQSFKLEYLVRKVYGCERFGVMHMADADYLSINPFYAAILIFSPKYYKKPYKEYLDIQNFIDRYEEYFHCNELPKYTSEDIDEYINELEALVRKHYRCLPKRRKNE